MLVTRSWYTISSSLALYHFQSRQRLPEAGMKPGPGRCGIIRTAVRPSLHVDDQYDGIQEVADLSKPFMLFEVKLYGKTEMGV